MEWTDPEGRKTDATPSRLSRRPPRRRLMTPRRQPEPDPDHGVSAGNPPRPEVRHGPAEGGTAGTPIYAGAQCTPEQQKQYETDTKANNGIFLIAAPREIT